MKEQWGDLRLNLGAGGCPLPGWHNLDAGYESAVAWTEGGAGKQQAEVYPLLDWPDACAATVRASHVLEHFSHHKTLAVLTEWVRVLKPGGILKIAVPDFAKICDEYQSGGSDWPIQGYVMGGQTDERDFHKAIFDEPGLREALEGLGLVDIRRWESEVQDCASLPVSLNLQGRKPGPDEDTAETSEDAVSAAPAPQETASGPTGDIHIPPGAVKAVMTLPRLAFTDTMFCVTKALQPLGIQIERTGGVFWDQGMTRAIEPHLEDGTRYVLTLDYDSVFEKSDVLELVRVMETRPEIDALCPWQMRRDEDAPLMCLGQTFADVEPGKPRMPREIEVPIEQLQADTMPILTGHFGLTLLRVEALKKLPKPWFLAIPDSEGTWGDGRTDSDIAFWMRWRDAGLSLHLANRVAIGHLQMVVSWPGRDLKLRNQFVSHYNRDGKPAAEVWR